MGATTRPSRTAGPVRAAAASRIDWLPQETILFDACSLHRTTRLAAVAVPAIPGGARAFATVALVA